MTGRVLLLRGSSAQLRRPAPRGTDQTLIKQNDRHSGFRLQTFEVYPLRGIALLRGWVNASARIDRVSCCV